MNTLLIMIIAHFIGDYLLQPEKLATDKAKKIKSLMVHALLYTAAMSMLFLCVQWTSVLIPLAIIAVSHLVIDEVKIQVERRKAKAKEKLICFCIDQVLHLAVVVICWLLFVRNAELTACFKNLSAISLFRPALAYLAILAIIWDPTSVLIKKVFCLFPPQEQNMEINDGTAPAKAGEWIGKLERLIVIALVLGGAVSSIAFVLTAKSVARFKQFEDKGFVERYLVGTLLSVSIALITALLAAAILK